MLWVVAETRQQFDMWCRARGYEVPSRGITCLLRSQPDKFRGIQFGPGDLVVDLEDIGENMSRSYLESVTELLARRRQARAAGYQYDETLPVPGAISVAKWGC